MMDDVTEVLEDTGTKRKEKKTKTPDTSSHEKIRYAYASSMLAEKIDELQMASEELEGQDLNWCHLNIANLKYHLEMIERVLEVETNTDLTALQTLLDRENMQSLNLVQRWNLYCSWKSQMGELLEKEIQVWESACNSLANELKDIETIEAAEIIRHVDIVGITTTGAAKHRALLEHLKSKIGK